MTGLIVSDRTGENIERGSFDRTGDSAPVSLNRPLRVRTTVELELAANCRAMNRTILGSLHGHTSTTLTVADGPGVEGR